MSTLTTDQERRPLTPEPPPQALEVAAGMVDRANLRMRRATTPDQARHALARALLAYPSDTPHGQLLAAACRRRNKAATRRGPRPDPERAARRLLEHGQVPTERAVAAVLRNVQARDQAEAARQARIRPLVESDGATVASFVRDHRRRTGDGPSWAQVRRHMRHRWRYSDGDAIIRGLCEAGWLVASREPGSLGPGPRAKGLAW